MKVAAAYIRVSTDDQLEYSPDSQLEKIRLYAERNQILLPKEFIFVDEGISGRKTKNRPAFNEMMSAIERGEIDTVIVYKFDRICRDLGSFRLFMEDLLCNNVKFISASDCFDTSDSLGLTTLKYLLLFSEMERKTHSERCRRGWERRKQRMEGC